MAKSNKKKPRFEASNKPDVKKQPVAREEPEPLGNPAWRIGWADDGGLWSTTAIDAENLAGILVRMKGWETMTWHAINGPDNHYSYENICKEAKARFKERNMVLFSDNLYSLRITGRRRLWGILTGGIFHILWWDPEHSVYPVAKKHT